MIFAENTSITDTGSGVIELGEDETVQTLRFQLLDDEVVEANEVLQVTLSIVGEDAGIDLTVDTTTLIITDDDGQLIL